MKRKSNEYKIFKELYNAKEPITGYALAKRMDLGLSSIYYYLKKLERWGVVYSFIDENAVRYYMLKPFFYDRDFWDLLLKKMSSILESINTEDRKYIEKIKGGEAIALLPTLKLLVEILTPS